MVAVIVFVIVRCRGGSGVIVAQVFNISGVCRRSGTCSGGVC